MLSVGDKFNSQLNNLLCCLEEIIFGKVFNQIVDYLPHSIKSIKFVSKFNQSVDNLPSELERIIFEKIKLFSKYKFIEIIKNTLDKYTIKELY